MVRGSVIACVALLAAPGAAGVNLARQKAVPSNPFGVLMPGGMPMPEGVTNYPGLPEIDTTEMDALWTLTMEALKNDGILNKTKLMIHQIDVLTSIYFKKVNELTDTFSASTANVSGDDAQLLAALSDYGRDTLAAAENLNGAICGGANAEVVPILHPVETKQKFAHWIPVVEAGINHAITEQASMWKGLKKQTAGQACQDFSDAMNPMHGLSAIGHNLSYGFEKLGRSVSTLGRALPLITGGDLNASLPVKDFVLSCLNLSSHIAQQATFSLDKFDQQVVPAITGKLGCVFSANGTATRVPPANVRESGATAMRPGLLLLALAAAFVSASFEV